jgi:nitroreductase
MNHRRRFLALSGGGAVLAAMPVSGCSQAYPQGAVKAWQPIAQDTDLRRWILAHALLAPNPHNRQPWIADLRRDLEIDLICDGQRLLPETDPYGRQILIGCGAFIELAVIAAAQRGVKLEVQLFPQGAPGPAQLPEQVMVARFKLGPANSATPDALFNMIHRRHTNKGEYDSTRKIAEGAVQRLRLEANSMGMQSDVLREDTALQTLKAIARRSYEIELTTPRTYLESARLFRIGPTEIEQHRDGIAINGRMPRLLNGLGLFNRMDIPVKGNSNYDLTMKRWLPFETGSGFLWIATSGNTRVQQIQAGRAYLRTHLSATSLGLDMHPLSQALQEFPEVKPYCEQMHLLLGFDPSKNTVQMLARVGYALNTAEGTPRRDLDSLLA